MSNPPPLPPPLPQQQHVGTPSYSAPKKRRGMKLGCIGVIIIGLIGFLAFIVIDSQQRTQAFQAERESILAEMHAADEAEDFDRVLEIARPYMAFGDSELDELVEKAEEATSFFGSIKRKAAETASDSPPGLRVVNGDYWYGAATTELFDQLMRYSIQKDEVAFKRLMVAGLATGATIYFKDGEEVFISDTSIFSGKMKVRRKGDTAEYWTVIEAAK